MRASDPAASARDEADAPADPRARTLAAEVLAIRWQAPEGGFAVVAARDEGGDELTLTGMLDHVHEGERLELEGEWRRHARHGWRFEVAHVTGSGSGSAAALLSLLAGVKHVGPLGAQWLLDQHGDEVLEQIDRDSRARLREVPGIGPARIGASVRSWERARGRRALRLFLAEHRVPAPAAARIERALGPEAIDRLKADPYCAIDVEGVGFATADALARALGFGTDADGRVDAGLLHALAEAGQDGHCLLPRRELEQRAERLLGAPVAGRIDELIAAGRLVADGELVAEPRMDRLERRLAASARRLATDAPTLRIEAPTPPDEGFVPTAAQWAVVDGVLSSRIAILTGGPGTGKTATMRALVGLLREHRRSVRLCAPTGKAARRLTELTGAPATTIHRMLGWVPGVGFDHGPDHPLPATDLLVVDEASMLSAELADALLGAIGPRGHVLLVGDVDQLAPVGPGRVLEDLIDSDEIPTVRLDEVFRQAARSLIVRAAHAVNEGRPPPRRAGEDDLRDFFVIERPDAASIFSEVVGLASERLAAHYELDPRADVLVLSPMHRGPVGVEALNDALRARLNPSGSAIPGTTLRIGDRVIQTRNDHEHDLMNGELALLAHHDRERDRVTLACDDGRRIALDAGDLGTLRPAYAISVHKAQGSQVPAIVVPVFAGHRMMLTRNLLYTAITRAERVCVLVGQPAALEAALAQRDTRRRHTRLARLVGAGG